MKLAYLCSRYPAVSHTFILREVLGLRARGYSIATASINLPDRPEEALTLDERAAAATTLYVKSSGIWAIVKALLSTLLVHPASTLAALALALRLGGGDLRRCLFGVFYWIEAVLVARWMAREGCQHLHVHFATEAATVGMLVSRLSGVTWSVTVHGPDEFYHVDRYALPAKFGSCDFIITIGDYARSQVLRLLDPSRWDRVIPVPLGVDPALFLPAPYRELPEPFWVLCVGRLVPAKGQHLLLDAVAHLRAEGRNIEVRLVGDGPDRASLEERARRHDLAGAVIFEGAVNQDRIRGFYEAADLFVLPSFAEGIPVVLMEAMVMEVACVTTWITGHPELIRDGQDGTLIPPGNTSALADAIRYLVDHPETRLRLARAGRVRVVEKYNLPNNIALLAGTFARCLQDTGGMTS